MPIQDEKLALDRASVRTIDPTSGHLHVSLTNISKANVCGYLGREFPGYEQLGLDANKIYQLYRDPEELKKGAATFNGKPLQIIHKAQSASDHDHKVVIGSVSNVAFNEPYLQAELSVWDQDAIDLIESGEQRELSCGYFWKPDMTPGVAGSEPYDGRMTSIIGNHVSVVSEGRAGPDVYVGDSKPEPPIPIPENIPATTPEIVPVISSYHSKESLLMAKQNAGFSRTALIASGALNAYLLPKITADQKIDLGPILKDVTAKNWAASKPKIKLALDAALEGKLVTDANIADLDDMLAVAVDASPDDDDDEEDKKKKAKEAAEKLKEAAADEDDDAAKDEKDDDCDEDDDDKKKKPAFLKDKSAKDKSAMDAEPTVSKAAMDAAIASAVKKARHDTEASTIARLRSIADAEKAVRPYIGELAIAQDSAEDVFKLCLDHAGIDLDGVPPAAYFALVKMLPKPGDVAPVAKQRQAYDSALITDMNKRFPGVTALKQR